MIHNFGIVDVDYPTQKCPFYNKWKNMIRRCYSEKEHLRNPTYIGCEVVDEWKYLSNFKLWMEAQDWEKNHLDKDILFPGNKIYGPETCIFVPPSLNSFMTNSSSKNNSGFNGVRFEKRTSKWYSQIYKDGKLNYIGTYNSREEAFYYYKIERNREILKWIEKIDDIKIKNALEKHLYILDENTSNFKGPLLKYARQSKKCFVDGIIYESIGKCAKSIGVCNGTISYRIKSKSFPNYYYISN